MPLKFAAPIDSKTSYKEFYIDFDYYSCLIYFDLSPSMEQ